MRNPLQEQLLKAGLVNKAKAAQVVREQAKRHKGKAPAPPSPEQIDARRLQAEKAEHDRAIAAEHNALTRASEARAQIRQIVETHRVKREGEITYRFRDGDKIRDVLINPSLRAQLAGGTLVIVRHEQSYELLPRVAADKVRERDAGMIVLDQGHGETRTSDGADDEYYKQFEVPDDLTW
ncbi:MAG: DUF2058 domain-containing protein [Rhodanobacter sp.]